MDTQIKETAEPQLEMLYRATELTEPINSIDSKQLSVLSLFSGCGGMDLGFEGDFIALRRSINEQLTPHFIKSIIDHDYVQVEKTRFRTVFANDISADARATWNSFFAKRGHDPYMFHGDSIVDLVKLHREGITVFPDSVDIVTGGFPCQDFSVAGKRNGFKSKKDHRGEIIKENSASVESRGQLYMWMKEVIDITKPKMFIAENVKGLVNLENVKNIIQSDFSSANDDGYIVLNPQVLHAADYGVAQSRERVIFIGIRKDALKDETLCQLQKDSISSLYDPYPQPTHSFKAIGENLSKPVQLHEVFKNIEEPEYSEDLSQRFYSKAKFMGKHCQGQTEINLFGIAPTIRSEHHGNIEFRRLSKANGGRIDSELKSGLKERRLTVRECALIQSFPPDFDFVIELKSTAKKNFLVSPSQAYKVVGNAVPPLLAYNLAKRLEEVWDLYFES
jgi:DNA (cytosine-5)-methyltransferase 1